MSEFVAILISSVSFDNWANSDHHWKDSKNEWPTVEWEDDEDDPNRSADDSREESREEAETDDEDVRRDESFQLDESLGPVEDDDEDEDQRNTNNEGSG